MLDENFALLLLMLKTCERLICVFDMNADRYDDTRLDPIVGKTSVLLKTLRESREDLEKDARLVASINNGG